MISKEHLPEGKRHRILSKEGKLKRPLIGLSQAYKLIYYALPLTFGRRSFVRRLTSFKITDTPPSRHHFPIGFGLDSAPVEVNFCIVKNTIISALVIFFALVAEGELTFATESFTSTENVFRVI